MKKLILYISFGIISFLQLTTSSAEDKQSMNMKEAPHFYALGNTDSNSVLKMECEGQEPLYLNITCIFTHSTITKKPETELKKEKIERELYYKNKTDKDIITYIDMLKTAQKKEIITKENNILSNSLTKEKIEYSDKIIKMINNM